MGLFDALNDPYNRRVLGGGLLDMAMMMQGRSPGAVAAVREDARRQGEAESMKEYRQAQLEQARLRAQREQAAYAQQQVEQARIAKAREALKAKYPQHAAAIDMGLHDQVFKNANPTAATWGVSPTIISGPDGTQQFVQFDNRGNMRTRPMPEGYAKQQPLVKIDQGDRTVLTDRGGRVVNTFDQNLGPAETPQYKQESAAATETGKRVAEDVYDAPKAIEDAEQTIGLLEELKTHPGREYATGKSAALPVIPGTAPYDFVNRLDQIKGKQFMAAYQQLKGGGQITEVEGKKAEQAIARMERAQSEPQFLSAVGEFQEILRRGVNRQKSKMQGQPTGSVNWSDL